MSILLRLSSLLLGIMLVALTASSQTRSPSGRLSPSRTPLAISEIMYHPAEGGAEFIEIRNTSSQACDLSGVSLSDGVTFGFPSGRTLGAGAYVVLVASEADFAARYPDVDHGGEYDGQLSNGGEKVTLSRGGLALLSLTYGDTIPWPAAADGHGYSLVMIDPGSDPGDPGNWRASTGLGGSPGHDDDVSFDPGDAMYAPDRVLEIEIEIAEADWNALRSQGRNRVNLFAGDCLAQPFYNEFTYFPATVTIDGVAAEQVGVRKKGFIGSLSRTKPAFKLKFDEFVEGRRLLGLERMTLNNTIQDPSYVSQCLGYEVFAAAGLAAPRCNFATVAVNGIDLGLYVNVESIKKPFLARNFRLNDGNLYEGTLSDFRPEFVATFERKNNPLDPDRSDLQAVVDALQAGSQDLVDALEPHVDLDAFLSFWTIEVLLGHWDGYTGNTNNYYLYRSQENDRFYFIPWGADQLLTDEHPYATSAGVAGTFATGMLARRLFLHQPTRELYVERVLELLDTVWDEDALVEEINRMGALISPRVPAAELGSLTQGLARARVFVRQRRAQLLALLQPEPPPWTEALRPTFCFPLIGDLATSFETTWGTYGFVDAFEAGSGTYSGTVQGAAQAVAVHAVAGFDGDPDAADMGVVMVAVTLNDGRALLVYVETDSALVGPGLTLIIEDPPTSGLLFEIDPAVGNYSRLIGELGGGTIHFDQIHTTHGSVVSGTIEGLVYEPTF